MQTSLFSIFQPYPELLVAVSQRSEGSLRLPTALEKEGLPELAAAARANRERAFASLGITADDVVSAHLTHSSNIAAAGKTGEIKGGSIVPDTDALVTADCGVFLAITVADCLPVFFYDPKDKITAIAHAGWRGVAGGILSNTVKKMIKEFGGGPENIVAAVGPGISACHFQVGDDLVKTFAAYPEALQQRGGASFIDLKLIARRQLEAAGLRSPNIEISDECTYCLPEKYFSWRRDRKKPLDPMMAIIGRRR